MDSLSYLVSFAAPSTRSSLISNVCQELNCLAEKHNLTVMCANQMTTDDKGQEIPAMGSTWAHSPARRIYLKSPEF